MSKFKVGNNSKHNTSSNIKPGTPNKESENETVVVNFGELDTSYECLTDWNKKEITSFWEFLQSKIQIRKWQDIYDDNGLRKKEISISSLPKGDLLNDLKNRDVSIFELRVSQKMRVFGYRSRRYFMICWLDKGHRITG
jgi:hypothetical protein